MKPSRRRHQELLRFVFLVQLLLLPQSSGRFQAHLNQVGESLTRELKRSFAVELPSYQQNEDTVVLILFQSQGSPGNEFPHVLPKELRGGQQKVLVAVVQDDEWTSCSRAIVPEDVNLVSVVNLHVVPGQSTLHAPGSSLCPRNKETISMIGQKLKLHSQSEGAIRMYWHVADNHQPWEGDIKAKLEALNIEFVSERDDPEAVFMCLADDGQLEMKKEDALGKLGPGNLKLKVVLATVHKSTAEPKNKIDGFGLFHYNRLRVYLYLDGRSPKDRVTGAEQAVKEIRQFVKGFFPSVRK